ncbi:sulfurtransferase [Paeniglutamicibacter cryotolerans]|uniref:Thiosulfate/3-mercaptopyruvate sulfurtransferase n=1 Tax=Paeniglutamicibacter cryotolerans TaxID=670079 RepID=A0A839QNK0_9MICC|nr:sulfurtransferase [Paeniglutamicibacter cryotolerans]MBB2996354.1 thiosulfate/3-mercaptopyruvate sulfurtransferase [Paeniglutamicibacter cryotolerans]
MKQDQLIGAGELARLLETPARIVLLDVRWALGDPNGFEHYVAGHLPGAVFVDLDTELAGCASAAAGRHPLPDPGDFGRAVARWGIGCGDVVVAYDDWGSMAAARAWWLLRHAGIIGIRVLDGGLGAWKRAGLPLEAGKPGPVSPPADPVDVGWGQLPVLDIEAAAAFPGQGVLLDARPAERFRGEAEVLDPRPGHIPGARNAPALANLDAEGRFLPAAVLRDRYAGLGITPETGPVGSYCGSGITASHQLLALGIAGIQGVLYPGSWSQYAADPGRPAELGDPGGLASTGTKA